MLRPGQTFRQSHAIHSTEIISGNHVTDFSGNPTKLIPQTKKAAGNIFGGGGREVAISAAVPQALPPTLRVSPPVSTTIFRNSGSGACRCGGSQPYPSPFPLSQLATDCRGLYIGLSHAQSLQVARINPERCTYQLPR